MTSPDLESWTAFIETEKLKVSRQKEATFRAKAMGVLRQLPNSHWFRIEQQSLRGTPDCMGVIRGNFFAFEFKASEKSPVTELQKYELEKVKKAGGVALVIHPDNWVEEIQNISAFAEFGISKPESGSFFS